MDENTKQEIVEIESLKKVKEGLEGEISRLQIVLNNLDAQAHTTQIKNEQDIKIQDAEKMNQYAAQERQIEIKRIGAEKRIDIAESMENKLNDREKEIVRREQKLIDLEDKIADLNRQRSNFEMYKVGIEKDLAEAKEIIAQADEVFAKIQIEKDMLTGREVKVREQEKHWNDCIGLLEEEKKKFQIEKENFIGLSKPVKEVVNA